MPVPSWLAFSFDSNELPWRHALNCRDFQKSLADYLRGEIDEPKFGALVEHEATCADCRRASTDLAVRLEEQTASIADGDFHREVFARTVGKDCDWVTLRMAEAMDEELPSSVLRPVREHLQECRTCQRLRDQLSALPDYYESLPTLQADRDFVSSVLDRTVGPRPGFLDVIRAIWKTPGTLWESAVACAIVAAVVFGSFVPSFDSVSNSVRTAAESAQVATAIQWERAGETSEEPSTFRRWADGAVSSWGQLVDTAEEVSEWSQRTSEDVRTRNYQGLLEDLRVVLEPIGLYPNPEERPETAGPPPTESVPEEK